MMEKEHSDIIIKIVAALTIIFLTLAVIVDIILLKLEPEYTALLILLLGLLLIFDMGYVIIIYYIGTFGNDKRKVKQ